MTLNYLLLWDYMGGWHAAHRAKAREETMRLAGHPVAEQDAFRRAMARQRPKGLFGVPVKRHLRLVTRR